LTCLKHLERQTFKDFEVVVVDDGSSDDTPDRMAEYQRTTPLSLRYVRQDNGGPAKARNLAISLLDTPLCLLLGDDIFISPTLLQEHVDAHAKHPNVNTAVLGLIRWNTTEQSVTPFMQWIDEENMQFCYPLLLAGKTPDWTNFYTSNLSVKTELLRRYPFDETFPYAAMEDTELAYRIEKEIGLEVIFIPKALADHLHPTTFRQACVRRVRIGYSTHLFHKRWPEMWSPQSAGLALRIKRKIIASKSLLRFFTELANTLTRLVCPNWLMRFVLHCHFLLGYEQQASRTHKGV
jgi:glycosyltransferase involved in cell wall biosynthesis